MAVTPPATWKAKARERRAITRGASKRIHHRFGFGGGSVTGFYHKLPLDDCRAALIDFGLFQGDEAALLALALEDAL